MATSSLPLPRVTELSNPVTDDIDMTTSEGIVRMLSTSDGQLFTGYGGLISLSDPEMVHTLARATRLIMQTLQHPKGRIIFSGCGTSGRLAHLESVSCNQLFRWMNSTTNSMNNNGVNNSSHDYFQYLLAGGDAALLIAQEAAEDKPDAGRGDIQQYLSSIISSLAVDSSVLLPSASLSSSPITTIMDTNKIPIVVIGISCGLSATYVGSMLEYVLECNGSIPISSSSFANDPKECALIVEHGKVFSLSAIALGFNPITAVSQVRVEGWANSFFQILSIMDTQQKQQQELPQASTGTVSNEEKALIINPIVGPESIAGSSRMKGGSATKIIVETLTVTAMDYLLQHKNNEKSMLTYSSINLSRVEECIREIFLQYETTIRQVYHHIPTIGAMVTTASTAVNTIVDKSLTTNISLSRIQQNLSFISPTPRGRIFYIGIGHAGLLGLIDASECSPTYGTLYNEVRGYLGGSWEELMNKEGTKEMYLPKHTRGDQGTLLASTPELIKIGVENGFLDDVLPTLTSADVVILLVIGNDSTFDNTGSNQFSKPLLMGLEGLKKAKQYGAQVRYVLIGKKLSSSSVNDDQVNDEYYQHQQNILTALTAVAPEGVHVPLSLTSIPLYSSSVVLSPGVIIGPQYFSEIALKLVLNAITTGAHVRKGTIYRNRMINLGLTNVKLFHRAVSIVQAVVSCSSVIGHRSILRAIYKVNDEGKNIYAEQPLNDLLARPVLSHVAAAASQLNIVPLAIVLAANMHHISNVSTVSSGISSTPLYLTVEQGQQLLNEEPIIRKAIVKALQS